MKIDGYEDIKASLDEFLKKENSSLDKYDLITKKFGLQLGNPNRKPENLQKLLKI